MFRKGMPNNTGIYLDETGPICNWTRFTLLNNHILSAKALQITKKIK